MKVLVTGAEGQLGHDVCCVLTQQRIDYIGTTRADLDITKYDMVEEKLLACPVDAVIHCAAYTAVDSAETAPELCWMVNVNGTQNVAAACKKIGAKMMYISTDYVFPGTGQSFYEVTDGTAPLNVYGKSKLAGELAVQAIMKNHFIVRTSWVFGKNGSNFVKTMLRLGKTCEQIDVVDDQIGSPTYTADLAVLLCNMIQTERYGVYHATNEGVCSWAEFARTIFQYSRKNILVNGVTTTSYSAKAKRPLNSRMSKYSLVEAGFSKLPFWQDALHRYLKEI